MSARGLERLVRQGRLEKVESDSAMAEVQFADAKRHLRSAAKLASEDPIMAYSAVYDAARKAVDAHMRVKGYKVGQGAGHHVKTFEYAREALAGRGIDDDLEYLDEMRSIRNDAEYRVRRVGDGDVKADLAVVERVVAAIEGDLEV
jgi:hypothetical protein